RRSRSGEVPAPRGVGAQSLPLPRLSPLLGRPLPRRDARGILAPTMKRYRSLLLHMKGPISSALELTSSDPLLFGEAEPLMATVEEDHAQSDDERDADKKPSCNERLGSGR